MQMPSYIGIGLGGCFRWLCRHVCLTIFTSVTVAKWSFHLPRHGSEDPGGASENTLSKHKGCEGCIIVTAQLNLNSSWVRQSNGLAHPPTTTTKGTCKALPGNIGSWFSVCNLILTQLEIRPQKNGRQPQQKMEDDLNFFLNRRWPSFFDTGRRPQFSFNWKMTSFSFKWKMTSKKWKTTSI